MKNIKKIKILKGKVIKKSSNKTIKILLLKTKKHKKYNKIIKIFSKMLVHDNNNEAKVNDIVQIKYFRPISKKKSWILYKILN